MNDCLIVGSGVIGLSLAWELAAQGIRVRLVERGRPGREASWAGAGILPPAVRRADDHPIEQLAGLAHQLHPQWAAQLREETGIDNGYHRCGGLYVARDPAQAAELRRELESWRGRGITVEEIPSTKLGDAEPAVRREGEHAVAAAWDVPHEAQIRNPRHLKALVEACLARGVMIDEGVTVEDFDISAGRVRSVRTSSGAIEAGAVCVTAGCWTRLLAERMGRSLAVMPIRGQMVLLACDRRPLRRIVHEGSRYIVPRRDGRVLIGSTEENAGFDRRTTAAGVAGLLELATSLVPRLAGGEVERTWAGLRPGTLDGLPYLGRVPDVENAFVAAGHFRSGLQLSTATAAVMGQLIRGEATEIDLSPFRLDRQHHQAATGAAP